MPRLLFALALILPTPALAYYDVLDNGEILGPGHYKITAGPQFLTDHGGLNLGAAFDAGFQEDFGVRGVFGFGTTDIFGGGMFKWMPFPDAEGQPAIGLNAGIIYGKDGGDRDLTFRLEPLISKRLETTGAVFTPYASLPVGLRTRDSEERGNKTEMAWQFVAGTQLKLDKWKNLQFIAEVGVDLDNALSHFSAAAILYFDDENGIVIE